MKLNTTPRVGVNDPQLTRELRNVATAVNLLADGRLAGTNNATTAAPTTGTHALGDFVRNSTPSGAAPILGWVCTVGGTPGTWVAVAGGTGGGVSSVAMTVPTGLSVSGSPITTTGTLAVVYSAGYSIPTDASQANWNTAFGWGNHATAGYATTAGVAAGYVALTGNQTVAGEKTFTDPAVVAVNSASTALRVTQTGAGNALLIEDEANPDASPFVVNASGAVGVGTTSLSGYSIRASKTITGATDAYGIVSDGVAQADVTSSARGFFSGIGTQATAFTVSDLYHFIASQGTIGAGSTVTEQQGFFAASSLTGATSNYGFRGEIASGTNRYNLYMNGTAQNYLAGNLGIGTTPGVTAKILIGGNVTGAATASTVSINPTFQSDVTTAARGYVTGLNTQATSFTLATLTHFEANQGTIGAGSTVTTQAGFYAPGSLTGATTNYGFLSGLAAASGRWNFYASGTAANYLNGDLRIGTTTQSGTAKLTVAGDVLLTTGNLGYATGSGGAVTQATSRTTGVTLNKSNGAITLVSAAGTTTWQTFVVTNSTVAATDTVIVVQKSGTDLNEIHVTAVAAGSFNVSFRTTGGTTTEQPVFNFAVIKAVAA